MTPTAAHPVDTEAFVGERPATCRGLAAHGLSSYTEKARSWERAPRPWAVALRGYGAATTPVVLSYIQSSFVTRIPHPNPAGGRAWQ